VVDEDDLFRRSVKSGTFAGRLYLIANLSSNAASEATSCGENGKDGIVAECRQISQRRWPLAGSGSASPVRATPALAPTPGRQAGRAVAERARKTDPAIDGRPPAAPASQHRVGDDAREPGGQARRAFEPIEAGEGSDVGFLRRIFGLRIFPESAARQAERPLIVLAHQRGESGPPARDQNCSSASPPHNQFGPTHSCKILPGPG
jgi:hypothetical protein